MRATGSRFRFRHTLHLRFSLGKGCLCACRLSLQRGWSFIHSPILYSFFKSKEHKKFHTVATLLFTLSVFLPYYAVAPVAVVLAFCVLFHRERAQEAFADVRAKCILGFCPVVGLVSVCYRNYSGALCALFVFLLLTLGFYLRSGMTRQLFHAALDLACLASVPCFAAAVVQKLIHLPLHPEYRPVSSFENANYYATVIEFVVLIALYRLSHCTGRRKLYLGVIGLNLIALYLTASMSAFASLSCAALVFLILKRKYRLALLLVAAVAAFVGISMLLPEFFPRVDMIDHTMGQRLGIWNVALQGVEEAPLFGQGPLTYWHICRRLGGMPVLHSHNLFLDTLLNFGLFGSLFLFFCALAQLRVILHRLQNNVCTGMNFLILAVVAGVLVHGVTDVTILGLQTGSLFLLICTSMGVQAVPRRVREMPSIASLRSLNRRMRQKYSREGSGGIYSIKR